VSAARALTHPARRRPITHAPGGWPARLPAALRTTTDGDRQTTGASEPNITDPLGGTVIRQESPLPLTDPRDAEAQRMLNIPYRIIW